MWSSMRRRNGPFPRSPKPPTSPKVVLRGQNHVAGEKLNSTFINERASRNEDGDEIPMRPLRLPHTVSFSNPVSNRFNNGGLRDHNGGSAHNRAPFSKPEVTGSADGLVIRVLAQQGLHKYSLDPEFVRYTSGEMQEALGMTREEMDRAAHRLLLQEQSGSPIAFPPHLTPDDLKTELDTDLEGSAEEEQGFSDNDQDL